MERNVESEDETLFGYIVVVICGNKEYCAFRIYSGYWSFEVGCAPQKGGVAGTLREFILVGVDVGIEVVEKMERATLRRMGSWNTDGGRERKVKALGGEKGLEGGRSGHG